MFFYHSDHLGSASWITDAHGDAIQHLQYLPFGEPFVDQRISGYSERFRFTGKERDEETGYGYFGARYMDHELMTMWLSVDPMMDKYPSFSPYAYCAWNPVKLVDPDGDSCVFATKDDERYVAQLLDRKSITYSQEFTDKYNDLKRSSHTYIFKSWDYSPDRDESGLFDPNTTINTSTIFFTKGQTPETNNPIWGASEFRPLFEEIFHAWKYENNNHTNVASCLSEAMAWQFSALAPGTQCFCSDIGDLTLMGYILNSSTETIAREFKFGFQNYNYPQTPLYSDLQLRPDNKFRTFIGLSEWK